LERVEGSRLVQSYISDGNASVGTASFESLGPDRTRVSMSISFEMSTVPFWTRPLRKQLVKLMARDVLTRYGDFVNQLPKESAHEG
jgi:hypothetical protein